MLDLKPKFLLHNGEYLPLLRGTITADAFLNTYGDCVDPVQPEVISAESAKACNVYLGQNDVNIDEFSNRGAVGGTEFVGMVTQDFVFLAQISYNTICV